MGYTASGCGEIHLNDIGIKEIEIVETIISKHKKHLEIVELTETKDGIYVYDSSTHWDEEYIWDLLNELEELDYVKDGQLDYSGEEDCIWRYVYNTDTGWEEENANIDYDFESYTDEQLIEELEKRGYQIVR